MFAPVSPRVVAALKAKRVPRVSPWVRKALTNQLPPKEFAR